MNDERGPSPSRAHAGIVQNGGSQTDTPRPAKKLKAKPLKDVLAKVLPLLQRRDLYQFFAQPVEPKEVPEYYSVIKHPMDFTTMERKLADGKYKTVDGFRVRSV